MVEEASRELTAQEAFDILKRISDADCELLGFKPKHCRPEWLVITVLPVPPPAVRPAVVMDASARAEDDLTTVLQDVIRENAEIRRLAETGAGDHIIQASCKRMQTRIAGYMDNTLPSMERLKHGGRAIKSISERLKGKHGRIRGNLMGKRVDFSARSVITGDATIGVDELGVPISISRNLTYPEVVTVYNREWLQDIVRLRAFKRIIRDVGTEVRSYFKVTGDFALEIGDVVERHLIDGDVVLFNRQPSLHKMSMMGHRVRVLPYSTFRLNLSVTTPYNADFDGEDIGDIYIRLSCCAFSWKRAPCLLMVSVRTWAYQNAKDKQSRFSASHPFPLYLLILSPSPEPHSTRTGDEMNMHVPQSPETRAEMKNLMMVPLNIVSPQRNKPVIGIVQDTLLGSSLITKRDVFIPKDVFMNICMCLEDWDGQIPMPAVLKPQPLWTGKQVRARTLDHLIMIIDHHHLILILILIT